MNLNVEKAAARISCPRCGLTVAATEGRCPRCAAPLMPLKFSCGHASSPHACGSCTSVGCQPASPESPPRSSAAGR